jgi:GTP cyclohydrolase III
VVGRVAASGLIQLVSRLAALSRRVDVDPFAAAEASQIIDELSRRIGEFTPDLGAFDRRVAAAVASRLMEALAKVGEALAEASAAAAARDRRGLEAAARKLGTYVPYLVLAGSGARVQAPLSLEGAVPWEATDVVAECGDVAAHVVDMIARSGGVYHYQLLAWARARGISREALGEAIRCMVSRGIVEVEMDRGGVRYVLPSSPAPARRRAVAAPRVEGRAEEGEKKEEEEEERGEGK